MRRRRMRRRRRRRRRRSVVSTFPFLLLTNLSLGKIG